MIPTSYPLFGLIACLAALAAVRLWPFVRPALHALCRRWLLIPFVLLAAYMGATKGTVSFPFTDPETRYLTDAGSYVTNDAVYVSFNRVLVPDSAMIYVEYHPEDSTSADDFETLWSGTLGSFANPSLLPCADAMQYSFIVYTTWTPGPSVKTNGVVDINMKRDSRTRRSVIPIRTGIYLDREKISPPDLNGGSNE